MGIMNTTDQRTRDTWLALRCQLGEADAYRELVAEMERPLLYFATKLLGDEDAALDVLQQTWLRAFQTVRRLHQPDQIRAWLYQIVRGLAIDRSRKRASVQRLEHEYAELQPEVNEDPTFDREDAAAVHRALDQLEPLHREVLLLHFLEDLPIAEVATIVGCPEGTVKSRLHHGKRLLRTLLRRASHD
jgi:RNA polymerase sigma-70 factor, ECF subfamily